jgi:hypothetical protein
LLFTDHNLHFINGRIIWNHIVERQLEVLKDPANAASTAQLPEDQAQGVDVGLLPRLKLETKIAL